MWIMVGESRIKAAAIICEYSSLARRKHRGWGRGWKEKLPHEEESLASCCCFVSISQGGSVLGKVSTQCPYKVCNLFLSHEIGHQFSRLVMSNSLWHYGPQHARLPCPSPTPRVYSDSCPLTQWCHPTISSSVVPFFSCLQSFPVSGSFQMSQFFKSGGQSIGVSPSTSVLPMNSQDWFPLDGLVGSLCSPRDIKSLQHHISKVSIILHSTYSPMLTFIWLLK